MARPGPDPYTEEPTRRTTVLMLTDAVRAIRRDHAEHDISLGALFVELSREYLDPAVRERVLRRVYARLGRYWPGEQPADAP